jgi:hypothetical protein
MTHAAFHLEVFGRVAATSAPPGSAAVAQLGALGPDLYEHLPISRALSDALHTVFRDAAGSAGSGMPIVDLGPIKADPTLAKELFAKPLMAVYSVLFREIVIDLWPVLQRDRDTLDALQAAVDAKDDNAVKALKSAVQQLGDDGKLLKGSQLLLKTFAVLVEEVIAVAKPFIEFTGANDKPWLPQAQRLFEFLRWHHTDKFAAALQSLADTADKKAYAFGHLCHLAASVTGRPFVNNISGGPYRTHWWRNRLVANHVDAWTFGRYETPASMSGDTPSPAYPAWKNVCNAGLYNGFNVAGFTLTATDIPDVVRAVASGDLGSLPSQFPPALASYLQAAIDAAYPAALRPPGFSTDAVGQSFTGLAAVTWFMTSGFGPLAWRADDLGPPPATCQTAPSWVTSGGTPPSPVSGPSTGETVLGIILAICALLAFLFGDWGIGAAALAGAIVELEQHNVDWDQFQCDTWWMRKTLLDGGLAVSNALVQLGLAYPTPDRLGTVDVNGLTHPVTDLSDNPVPLTKSFVNRADQHYPLQMWADTAANAQALPDMDFSKFPKSPLETPATPDLPLPASYPDVIVDGSGLQHGGLRAGGTFPTAGLFFGDAVANALDLITHGIAGLPDYNLDGDRGYGWLAWNAEPGTFPGSGDCHVKPEH